MFFLVIGINLLKGEFSMIRAVADLNPYQKSLLADAGPQQQTISSVISQALENPQAFRDSETVKKLSTAIQQIPLPRLASFLSAFRKLIRDCHLNTDLITFVVAKSQCQISRVFVIAYSHIWATNLSYPTQDQTQPIVLIKPDEASPPFQPAIIQRLLIFLISQKLPDPFPENAKKSMILAADFYGIPSLRLAIHETISIASDGDLLTWLRFSHSTSFQDKAPNRHLRTCLQLIADVRNISQYFIDNNFRTEEETCYYKCLIFNYIHLFQYF